MRLSLKRFSDLSKALLYGFPRSSASWRVRATLMYKGVDFSNQFCDPNAWKSEEQKISYLKINSFGQVPTLLIDGLTFTQSVAILEYLEETRP